ncbi:MAG: hypothetical protein JO295_10545 [Verrucomicrobia bacterium]|nr:hypothetical protein [Verrucomicrobiota bacterium]
MIPTLFYPSFLAAAPDDNVLGRYARMLLPVVLVLLALQFLLRGKMKALSTKLSHENINNPQGGPHQHSLWARLYFRATGLLVANTLGRIARYHPRHIAFLSSGSVCPHCGQTLFTSSWMPLVRCYDAAGNPVALTEASQRGAEFGCPQCQYRWPIRKPA